MSGVTMHWAAEYIGKPWRSGAQGPDAYYCWGLVQRLCRERLGLAMPDVATNADASQFAEIFEAARGLGWRLVTEGPPRANDVVMMRTRAGDRHCGYMVEADGRLGVLHADGHNTTRGPVGQVVFETLADAMSGGYSRIELWRHGRRA